MECEMKVLVGAEHWQNIKSQIPDGIDDKEREVWFFETPNLMFKQHELILRARIHPKKKEAESTAKWRRWVSPHAAVVAAWQELEAEGFKAEIDATVSESVPAWSISCDKLSEQDFKDAQDSTKQLLTFFGDEQQLLVRSAWPRAAWEKLRAYGPITSVKWTIPDSVSIERWSIREESLIEVSKRGDDPTVALEEIRVWLQAAGVAGEGISGGKTAWALQRLVLGDGG